MPEARFHHSLIVEPLPTTDLVSASVLIHGLKDGPKRISVVANVPLEGGNGAWLPATLPMAMSLDFALHLEGPQDSTALENAAGIQKLLNSWFGDLHLINIISGQATKPPPEQLRGVGCFFSGGVDSFYSAIERSEDITHLIFVTGFDIDVEDDLLSAASRGGGPACR
jgi:hypothetical protein